MAGCSGAAEQPIIGQFFAASRLLDFTALGNVATVVFDPRTQGAVMRFTIERVSPEQEGRKEVTVAAVVRLPGGGRARKTLIVSMQRAVVEADRRGRVPEAQGPKEPAPGGGWIITGFRDAARSH